MYTTQKDAHNREFALFQINNQIKKINAIERESGVTQANCTGACSWRCIIMCIGWDFAEWSERCGFISRRSQVRIPVVAAK
jgi:hypothetical protein